MSVLIEATVRCDAEECISVICRSKDTLLIRVLAEERHGWQCLEDGRDFCPAHHVSNLENDWKTIENLPNRELKK